VELSEVNSAISRMDQVTQRTQPWWKKRTPPSHTLAMDAENLTELVDRFRLGEGMTARKAPQEATAVRHSRPSRAKPHQQSCGRI
jgi:methyl-accepting chemotaxis protein